MQVTGRGRFETIRLTLIKTLVVLVGAAFAAPAGYVLWRNYTYEADFVELITSPRILAALERSLRLAFAVSISATALGVTLAWFVVRTKLRGRRIFGPLLMLPLVYPSFLGAAAFMRTMSSGGLIDRALKAIAQSCQQRCLGLSAFDLSELGFGYNVRGFWGAWLILTLFTYPYIYMPVAARLTQLGSAGEESARLLGDNTWTIVHKIVWPQISSSAAAGALLAFLYTVSDYGAVQMMRYDTLTRAIAMNHLARPDIAFGLSLVLLCVAISIVVVERRIAQRSLRHIAPQRLPRTDHTGTGQQRTGQTGTAPPKQSAPNETASNLASRPTSALVLSNSLGAKNTVIYTLGRWSVPVFAAVATVTFVAVALPLISIIEWAVRGLVRAQSGHALSLSAERIFEATLNTTQISLLAAAATILVVTPVAIVRSKLRSSLGSVVHAVIISGYAVPGVLVALALRFWTLRAGPVGEWLYDSMTLFVLAYILRFASLALSTLAISFASVPQSLKDAASTLGASPLKRIRTVDAVIVAPSVAAAFGLVLLAVMKELPIALFISPLGYRTLAARIFTSFEEAFVAEAGIMACILVAISAALSWLLLIRKSP